MLYNSSRLGSRPSLFPRGGTSPSNVPVTAHRVIDSYHENGSMAAEEVMEKAFEAVLMDRNEKEKGVEDGGR